MSKFTRILAGIALTACGVTQVHAVPVGTSFGTATIDGALGPGEWDNAISWSVFSGAYAGSTFFAMNDSDNLYLALSVVDSTLAVDDIMEVRFDNANNGTSDAGDDELFLSLAGFTDSHFSGVSWGIPDLTHGTGAIQRIGSSNVFEMAHPLNSGDAFDFSLTAGDTVGMCLRYFDDGLATSATTTFPTDCQLAVNEQALYVDYVVAVPEPSTLALFAIGLAGIGWSRRRKTR